MLDEVFPPFDRQVVALDVFDFVPVEFLYFIGCDVEILPSSEQRVVLICLEAA